jgi:hypothetical protein
MKLDYPAQALKRNARHAVSDAIERDGRTVSAGRLVNWILAGGRAVLAQPTLWMAVFALCACLLMLFKALPLLRPLVALAAPLIAGGLIYAQARIAHDDPASIGEVLAAVGAKSNALLAVGLMSGAVVAIGYLFMIAAMNLSLLASIMTTGVRSVSISYGGDAGMRGAIESLVSAPIFTIAIGAAWFAPALVMLHDVAPLEAMMASLNGAARNWGASAFFVVLLTGACLLAPALPLFVSALVLTPLMLLSIYGAYRDVFVK